MEWLDGTFQELVNLIEWPYLAMFILFSYLAKKILGEWLEKITHSKWKPVYTVLIIATIIGIPHAIFGETTITQLVLTYAVGTSFYETILEYGIKKFKF